MDFDLTLSIDVLARTPGTLRALLGGLAEPNAGRSLASLLDELGRAANLTLLRSWRLSAADLDLPGAHPNLGRVTLRELLAAWVVHDLGHIAQIARVMAKQYGDQVGPWVPFLPVLTDHPVPRS